MVDYLSSGTLIETTLLGLSVPGNRKGTKHMVTQMTDSDPDLDEMPTNCDFTDRAHPAIGKYAGRVTDNVRLVRLDSDVAVRFPNAEAVNAALRSIAAPDANADG